MAADLGDAALIEAVLARDNDAWPLFVDRYHKLVWHIVHSAGVDFVEKEDTVQIVFLRLAERLHTVREPDKLTGFVAAVARNTARESIRRSARSRASTDQPDQLLDLVALEDSPEEAVVNADEVVSAFAGLRRLTEECQRLLRLFFGADMTTVQVASHLEREPGTIRVQKMRCLDRLRQTPEVVSLMAAGGST